MDLLTCDFGARSYASACVRIGLRIGLVCRVKLFMVISEITLIMLSDFVLLSCSRFVVLHKYE